MPTSSSASCSGERWAVLVPAMPPHFGYLSRLVERTMHFGSDTDDCIQLHAILDSASDIAAFKQTHGHAAKHVRFIAFDDVLRKRANTSWPELLELRRNHSRRHVGPTDGEGPSPLWCWPVERRVVGGLKKLYGALELHHRGFSHAWVMDAESVPLRQFSFAPIFREFAARPRLLRINISSPLVESTGIARASTIGQAVCTAYGLRILNKSTWRERGVATLPFGYHATDYWIYVLSDVAAMVQATERAWGDGRSFAAIYARFPALEYAYYSAYIDKLAPAERRYDMIDLPEVLSSVPSFPTDGRKMPVDDLSPFLLGKKGEDCNQPLGLSLGLSLQQRVDLLSSPHFSWVHGHRFDYMDPKCRNFTEAVLRSVPTITWATSNYNGQIRTDHLELEVPPAAILPAPDVPVPTTATDGGGGARSAQKQQSPSRENSLLREHAKYHQLDAAKVVDGKCSKVALPGLETGTSTKHAFCAGTITGLEDGLWLGGWHEPQVVHAVLNPMRAGGGPFWDIGANAGLLSVVALSGNYTEVLSFEPQPACADALLYMRSQNGGEPRWRIFNVGVSRNALTINVPIDGCGMNWQWMPATSSRRSWHAHAVSLASIAALGQPQGREAAPTFIKIDVDGAEVAVVEGVLDAIKDGALPVLPELYVEVDIRDWQTFNGTTPERGIAAFEALGALYEEIYFFSGMQGSCEGIGLYADDDPTRNLTTPYLFVSENHPPPSIRRFYGRGLPQWILLVTDYKALLRRCVTHKRQLNLWFAR